MFLGLKNRQKGRFSAVFRGKRIGFYRKNVIINEAVDGFVLDLYQIRIKSLYNNTIIMLIIFLCMVCVKIKSPEICGAAVKIEYLKGV